MPFYLNDKCPVCDKRFESEDDIVTCPHCGTPHHRECYNSLGHCINSDKHGTDFSFKSSQEIPEDNSNSDNGKEGIYYQPKSADSQGKVKCVNCGEELESSAPFCKKCGARQPNPQLSDFTNPVPSFAMPSSTTAEPKYNEDETLDGVSVNELAAIIRSNIERFVRKFKGGKKLSWNWGAFFFGPYYLFFRKMYKEGALFLAVRLIMSLITQGVYATEYNEFASFVMSNLDALRNPTEELMAQMTPLYEAIIPFALIQFGGLLLINIIIALFADNIYKDKVFSIAKKVNEKINEGSQFGQSVSFIGLDQPELSQKEMKNLYLGKLGGTTLFSPLIAYFLYDLVTSFIAQL